MYVRMYVHRFLDIQNPHGSLRIIVITCPIQIPSFYFRHKDIEDQFSEFPTGVISQQLAWPL
jgi:hypothetical protein